MKLTNEITDRCIKYYGDILQARDRKSMRAIITRQNRDRKMVTNESKRIAKEEKAMLQENWKLIESRYQPKH